MKIFGSWSVISFLRFIAQFIWAVLLVTLIILGFMLGLFIYSSGEIGGIFPVYIDGTGFTDLLRQIFEEDSVVLTLKNGVQMSYTPLGGDVIFGTLLSLFQIGLIGLALYGFSVLKRVLDSMHKTDTFTLSNGSDIRIVGILLVIAAPLKFLYEWACGAYFSLNVTSGTISSVIPPIDFTLFFAGLTCFVLAEILNQATIMHEEQKLTV